MLLFPHFVVLLIDYSAIAISRSVIVSGSEIQNFFILKTYHKIKQEIFVYILTLYLFSCKQDDEKKKITIM